MYKSLKPSYMNHSKIFLGATSCLLAIAGVAATKAAKFGSTTATYFTQVAVIGQHACILYHPRHVAQMNFVAVAGDAIITLMGRFTLKPLSLFTLE